MNSSDLHEVAVRFFLGGAIVSAFSILGELFKPKTFAGIFGAAPSVALATLALAFHTHGAPFVAVETRSMLLGAVAFVGYSAASMVIVRRETVPVWLGAGLSWAVWFAIAFGLWWAISSVT